MKSVCVYLGSNAGDDPAYTEATVALARLIAARGLTLVYGGASVGLMGRLADEALAAGGHVLGVIPQGLVDREKAHTGGVELRVVADMHERKLAMADAADAFVALPGGLGTLEELFETWTWAYLGIHSKPVGVLDVLGYYGPLLAWLDAAVEKGFIKPQSRSLLLAASDPAELLDRLAERAA